MPGDDYYKTLGVSRDASDAEIRKAYKKLAREYHPDRRPNDKAAAEKFKKVQEAYAILGDAEKRAQYNRYGAAYANARRGPFAHGGPGAGPGPIDLSDLFGGQIDLGDLFGAGAGRGSGRRSGFGKGGFETHRAAPRRGEDLQIEVTVPFQIAAEGGSHPIQLRREGKSERLNVKIPAGIDDGSVVRLAGQGHPSHEGGPAGDMLVTVHVAPHPYFRREGSNLLLDVPITPSEAVLGAKVQVPTLAEGTVTVTIPPGTSTGTKLRLRGKGLANPKTKGHGDQLVVVKVVVPPRPGEKTRALYQQIAQAEKFDPRAGLW